MTKICAFCGQEFETDKRAKKFCDRQHFDACVICGNQFEVPYSRLGAADRSRVCSTKCRKQLAEQTCFEKYGVSHHLSNPEVIAKRTATVREKYGVDNVVQSDIGKQHIRETFQQKYGVNNISQLPEIQQKIRDSNIKKYGVEHPMMLPEYKAKAIQTNVQKYGRQAYTQQHIQNIKAWYSFVEDPKAYIQSTYREPPRSIQIAEDLGVDLSTVDLYLSKHEAFGCIIQATSTMELSVEQMIRSVAPDAQIIRHDRCMIHPYELDIYLPEYRLAIECNPTVTHNSSFEDPWGGSPKSHNYHKIKSLRCADAGIFLFHIFGYEWTHKQPIMQSMICNLLKCNNSTIYARKCEIRSVNAKDCMVFLNTNHRQGYVASPINLGLYFQDELVALMTFGHARNTIGSLELSEQAYELVRFCSKLNTSVIGGADKLFKRFLGLYSPSTIMSFSDIAHTRGNLYSQLGFHKLRESEANYVWVDVASDKAYHRANAQKSRLAKFLKDPNIDLTKSEKQLMEAHNFAQVFDSGTITWVWEPR